MTAAVARTRVLFVDDDEEDALLIRRALIAEGQGRYDIDWVECKQAAMEALTRSHYDVLLIDYHLRGENGVDLVRATRNGGGGPPAILLTGQVSSAADRAAMQAGATDFLEKNRLDGTTLERALRYAVERSRTDLERRALIAERTAALDALQKRERYFRSLIENATDPIVTVDASGTITYASPAIRRVLGYEPAELVNVSASALGLGDDGNQWRALFGGLLENPSKIVVAEVRTRHQDGSWRLIRNTARNLLADPAVGGIVINLHDVTDEKLLAEQLRQAQKLEAVGQLAGGVAHDFNNIVTIIKLHGEFLSEDLAETDPRREEVEEIRKAAERAASLTKQLLAFSRKQVLQPLVVDLNAIVAELAPMLRRLIGEDVEFGTIVAPTPMPVLADPGQIEQVLMNLAINARDAMLNGGALTIETQLAELDENYVSRHDVVVPGKYVMLGVSDTGVGMDAGVRDRIFEPFFTTKQPGKGTGLGLATVYGIVKQSNGYVWVYSEPGKGTAFKIFLPYVDADISAGVKSPPVPAPSGWETVLLVEDEDAVRNLSRRILVRQGYNVLEARHGADALELARDYKGKIHIVVTDVVMPQMNGRELVERLRTVRPATKAVFMSGYTNDDIIRRSALDPGNRRLIQKPFTADALASAVRAALDEQ